MFENFSLFPRSASTVSGQVDALYLFLVAVSAFFVALIVTALVIFSIRYRKRAGQPAEQIEGSLTLEIFWTAVPLALALVMFGWGAKVYFEVMAPPSEGMQFNVTGKQWMWKIQHPTGHREINTLHVPVGEPVILTMISEDVIHDFYVPAFRVKADVVPGRYSQIWFEATEVGEYHLFCAEYCGTKHSEMIGKVVAMDPADYQQWLTGQPAGVDPVVAGATLYENLRCNTCHEEGPGQKGPLLERFGETVLTEAGEAVLFDEGYVRESILEPNARLSAGFTAQMPSYAGQVTEEQIVQLIAFIKTLKPEDEAAEAQGGGQDQ